MSHGPIDEDFAGPGGWDTGAAMVGVHGIVGYEHDRHAVETAIAAGFVRVHCDVQDVDRTGRTLWGYIGSPPCQAWSRAGKRQGILDQPAIFAHLRAIIAAGQWIDYPRTGWHDDRSPLVLEVVRAIMQARPTWIALEQVPDVLPFWELLGELLTLLGYRWWCGILDAEMYGVPQTRDRAILTASLDPSHNVSRPPATHHRYRPGRDYTADLFDDLLPPVSMAQALGWGMEERPSMTVTGGGTGSGGAEPFGHAARAGIERERERERGVPAYRLARGVGMSERHGQRADTPVTEPAPTISTKARTASWVEHAVVQTGNNSMVTGRTGSRAGDGDVQKYERPVNRPAPTVDCGAGSKWSVVYHKNRSAHFLADNPRRDHPVDEPAPTVTAKARSDEWVNTRPCTAVQGDPRIAAPGHKDRAGGEPQFGEDSVRVTVEEAATLQSFPPDYPWQGSRTAQFRQVGDAIPSLLAAAILGHLLNREGWRDVCRDAYRQDGAA